jgi:serine/threonine protein kinase
MTDNSNILKVYGISQNPDTGNYIIVLYYAAGGNFNNWINVNYKIFSWEKKLRILTNIARGLKGIHEKQLIHHDFHTGNILFDTPSIEENANKTYISDMGLCRKVDDINQNNVYGVMPYVAPEVLRGKPYTQAADIYSFGMVMYFVATGRQPFDNCAHDYNLALDICKKGVRPELNEQEAPKSYISLMKECFNSNPNDRPSVTSLCRLLWSITLNNSEIEEAESYRILHPKEVKQINIHPQAIYISRLLNDFTECLDCSID